MRFVDTIEVKQNLKLTAFARGKVVAKREGHNIWLNLGREYLAQVITFASFGPDTPVRSDRIKYMGLGIGGNRQLALSTANSSPISPPYVGSNAQTDSDADVTVLERPVRVSGSSASYPGLAGDAWIGTIQAPADFSIPREVTYRRVFTPLEVSYGDFLSVPVSEIGLFTSAADPENYQNTMVAYDTFDTLSKTSATSIQVVWTIRF